MSLQQSMQQQATCFSSQSEGNIYIFLPPSSLLLIKQTNKNSTGCIQQHVVFLFSPPFTSRGNPPKPVALPRSPSQFDYRTLQFPLPAVAKIVAQCCLHHAPQFSRHLSSTKTLPGFLSCFFPKMFILFLRGYALKKKFLFLSVLSVQIREGVFNCGHTEQKHLNQISPDSVFIVRSLFLSHSRISKYEMKGLLYNSFPPMRMCSWGSC